MNDIHFAIMLLSIGELVAGLYDKKIKRRSQK